MWERWPEDVRDLSLPPLLLVYVQYLIGSDQLYLSLSDSRKSARMEGRGVEGNEMMLCGAMFSLNKNTSENTEHMSRIGGECYRMHFLWLIVLCVDYATNIKSRMLIFSCAGDGVSHMSCPTRWQHCNGCYRDMMWGKMLTDKCNQSQLPSFIYWFKTQGCTWECVEYHMLSVWSLLKAAGEKIYMKY